MITNFNYFRQSIGLKTKLTSNIYSGFLVSKESRRQINEIVEVSTRMIHEILYKEQSILLEKKRKKRKKGK